jgi:transposase
MKGMSNTLLLPLPEGMLIEQIEHTETGLCITGIATHPTSRCPLCSEPSSFIHSRYKRSVHDVPCGGRRVQLVLTMRKFFCRNSWCPRKVFTERILSLWILGRV